jgi:hypothetical protein
LDNSHYTIMQIHILRGQESTGPYTPDQVRDYYNQGTLLPTDFAYHDGLAGWVPLEQLLAELPPIVETPALAQLPQGIVHKEPEASSSVHAVTPPKAKKKIQLMVAVVVGLLVLGGLAFGGWKLFKGTEPIQTAQNQIPPKAEQKVNSDQPPSPNPAEAPPITSTPVGTNTVVETPEPPSGEGSGGKTNELVDVEGINQTSKVKIGTPIWEFETEGWVSSSPAIGSDGTVYVGSDDKKLYAIKTASKGLAKSPWPMRGQNARHTGRVMKK